MGALLLAVGAEPAQVVAELVEQGGLDALGRSIVLAVFAVLVGGVTGTLGGLVILYGRGGWLEPVATALGVKVLFATPGLFLATAFVCLPFFVREVALVLEEVGTSEEDAARTLGASEWQVFVWVTLPQLRGALRVGTLLTVARALGEFGAVLVLGGAIEGRTQTATTFVHTMMEERHDAGAFGMSLILAAPTL